jgi:uncharacterized protein DUF4242
MKLKSVWSLVVAGALLSLGSVSALAADHATAHKKKVLHTYVIERTIPGAGDLSKAQLRDISIKSNGVLKDMGPGIKWVDSFVTQDKVYCIYKAENEDLVREHAKRGGFPADKVSEVKTVISPATGK